MSLKLINVSKKFLKYERDDSLKNSFINLFNKKRLKKEWTVLRDISFEIKEGERLGIIGKNGSGKSTLLKLIAKIYKPDSGKIFNRFNRTLAILELGAGFFPDLTGRENLRLNWAFSGLSQAELKNKFFDIAEFAGISNFIDTPLKYYSSGMSARLAFSIAAFSDPDLLILDEVLSVGDAEFKEKSLNRINELLLQGTSVIFVSHNFDDIKRICTKSIYLENGTMKFYGDTEEAIYEYEKKIAEVQINELLMEQT